MRKDAGESDPRNDTGASLKEQNHNFAERFIDSSKLIDKYSWVIFYTFESAEQLQVRKK